MIATNLLAAAVDMAVDILQRNSRYVRATNRNYAAPVTGGHLDEAKIAIPGVVTTRDIAGAASYVSDPEPTIKSVKLTEHRGASLELSDFDQQRILQGVVPAELETRIKALANYMDSFIAAKSLQFYNHVGTANVVPFGAGVDEFWAAMAKLDSEDAPENRVLILTPQANEALNNTRDLRDKNFAGLSAPYGWSNRVPSNPSVTASGYEVNTAGASAGDTSVPTKTGTGTFGVGTVINFAGHEGDYTVESQTSTTSITVYPALRAAVTNGEDIAVMSGGKQNLLVCPDAIAFACSAMQDAVVPSGADIAFSNDPVSGLGLRLEVSRNSKDKKTIWDFDAAFGATVVYRNLGVRISGK